MVGTESGPEGGDNDRRRFLVLATKLGLAVPPVVTLALARRSYAAGSGFKDPPGGGGGGEIGGLGGGSSSGGSNHHNPPPRNFENSFDHDHDHDHHRN
jgi:hypothetical protein